MRGKDIENLNPRSGSGYSALSWLLTIVVFRSSPYWMQKKPGRHAARVLLLVLLSARKCLYPGGAFEHEEGVQVTAVADAQETSELSFIGHVTQQAISEFRADKVIIGTPAISLEHGLTHEFMPETMTDRAVLKISSCVIVVADHTKFERVATSFLAPIEKVNTIVTDGGINTQLVEDIENKGVRVVVAN